MVTLNGKVEYPKNIIPILSKQIQTIEVNATETAIELGNSKVMNIIMLGALVKAMDLCDLDFETAITENVKPKFIELNLKAFEIGQNIK
jgi:indolepyruvate ferredoxin oxidoreductase beta subunit